MNDNLDDFLNSLGIPDPTVDDTQQIVATSTSTAQEEPRTLSNEDFDDILEEYGFNRPQDAQAEEISDIDEANREAIRDLDAEEDADWQEAIDSGGISPVVESSGITMDSDSRGYIIDPFNGQRVYLRSEVVDAINSTSSSVASNILARNRELIAADESTTSEETAPAPQNEPLIPLNSPTLLMDESTTRFSGAEWFNEIQKKSIILAGLGGIGSWTALQLARMVPANLVLYDDDTVETVNMAGQLYRRDDVGRPKASAVSNILTHFTNMHNIFALQERFTENTEAGDIMICGFDNMKARELFFVSWRNHVMSKPVEERKNCLYIDGRLSIDTLQVFCITGDDDDYMTQYRLKHLFSDADAEHTVCSMKQTTYLACMIGSVIVNLFTNWCANLVDPIIPYDLPFFTEYDSQNMILKTEK